MQSRRIAYAFVIVLVAACQSGKSDSSQEPAASATAKDDGRGHLEPYARDIDSICRSIELSGAEAQEEGARQIFIAQWLGRAIQTEEGREFLAGLSTTPADKKATLLVAEAKKVGFADCDLAESWRGGGESVPPE